MRNKYISELRKAKAQYMSDLANKLSRHGEISPKSWWSLAKHFLGTTSDTKDSMPSLYVNNLVLSSPMDKCEALNTYFSDISCVDSSGTSLPPLSMRTHSVFSNVLATESEIEHILKGLDINKACGPDQISHRLLKLTAHAITSSLTKLINFSLANCCVPNLWKQANVCPIFKGGDNSMLSNYRPISLISCVGKIAERVIANHLYDYLTSNDLINQNQSGFIPGDSCELQLLNVYDSLVKSLDHKDETVIVFCDISKAFDRVWHDGLIHKIETYGITGDLLTWLNNYLRCRKQRVTLNGISSSWLPLKAGVPQGSVLGPLLFLLYINDIADGLQSNIHLFADDVVLYLAKKTIHEAIPTVQSDLNHIESWARQWVIKFSPTKSEMMVITRRKQDLPTNMINFCGSVLRRVDQHKHLGLFISQDLCWHSHIEMISNKASNRLLLLKRLKYVLDRHTLQILYKSFIRPLLEYASAVWDNCTEYEKHKLESIQYKAALVVSGAMKGTGRTNLYEELAWETLESRRARRKLVIFHSMVYSYCPRHLQLLLPQTVGSYIILFGMLRILFCRIVVQVSIIILLFLQWFVHGMIFLWK